MGEEYPDEEKIVEELREALELGELLGGLSVGVLAWALRGKTTGFWELGVLTGVVGRQWSVLKKHGIDPRSEKGQELLRKSREGTIFQLLRLPRLLVKSEEKE